ncbi:MAG TPA: hypothetical protein VN441_04265 [Syntrophomonas sp.]|nr:hypothetical protein [Syntrophomonas sp.]
MNKQWFHCPVCGQKLCQCTEKAQGVYIKCKKCKQEVEVKIKKGA